ncbi:MAG: GNAT family N-acetyltransferase [Bacillus sp. (in: firmicutes)]
MSWYEKLNEYFPIEEMKSKQHVETLLKEKEDYYKSESDKHVLLYVEKEDYIFVDYLLVSKKARGEGLGKKLLAELKEKNKIIVLEVEPAIQDVPDSFKRLNFYKREQFKHASSIIYRRISLATKEENEMEILYWSPTDVSEKKILSTMKQVYKEFHTYKDKYIYGKSYQPADEVLQMETKAKGNILRAI